MVLAADALMSMTPVVRRDRYGVRDTILYALGVGIGQRAADDPRWLRYVHEEGLVALPTMAVVLASPGFWMRDPQWGLDWRRILHGEQSIFLHRPIAPEGEVRSETSVEAIIDKGVDRGAIAHTLRRIIDDTSGETIADVRQAFFLRGDGGCGDRIGGAPVPTVASVPDRAPDLVFDVGTRPEQALLYRLCGDPNPLHVLPDAARAAGFERPVLHGLASYGAAGATIVDALCGGDAARLRRFDARFSSPVYPGETLRVALWRETPGRAAMQVRLVERDVIVLNNGYIDHDV